MIAAAQCLTVDTVARVQYEKRTEKVDELTS